MIHAIVPSEAKGESQVAPHGGWVVKRVAGCLARQVERQTQRGARSLGSC